MTESAILLVPLGAVLGALVGAVLACIPGLHVYNVLAIIFIFIYRAIGNGMQVSTDLAVPFITGIMVGYAVLNSIPSVLLSAPDESALFTVLPGQNLMFKGRGYEAVLMTILGSALGLLFLTVIAGPLTPFFLPTARRVLAGHTHWILWCVITFVLMSEWPKGGNTGQAGWRRLAAGWRSTSVGLLTFLLSGILGFIVFYRSPVAVTASFQNLLPAFVGLFTLPSLLVNLASRSDMPEQDVSVPGAIDFASTAKGAFAGILGGGFAAFFPVVTGGVGGLLAGHATAVRDDRVFLISQGASKLVYYVGALLFFSVPGFGMTRGGCAWMLRGLYLPRTCTDYHMMLASIAVAGVVAVALAAPLTRAVLRCIHKAGHRRISLAALVIIILIVLVVTGMPGLLVALVATGIGLLPVLFGSRRMNCLGVILLPMACAMSGFGADVAAWMGLL